MTVARGGREWYQVLGRGLEESGVVIAGKERGLLLEKSGNVSDMCG